MELCEKLYGGWRASEFIHKLGRMFAVLVLFSLLTAFVSVGHTAGVNSLRPESAADLSHKADAKVAAAGGMSVSEGFLPENIADFAVRLEEMIRNSAVLENGRLPAADISLSTAISADMDTVAALSASALPSADRDAGAADDAAVPIIPDEPTVPVVPDEPAVPVVPDEPAVPVVPDEPVVPVVPDEPSAPPANIADETPDAGAEEDASPDSSNPDVPGAVMTTVNGFYVNEAGMICGIADPETAVSDGYAEIPAEGCTGIAAGAFDAIIGQLAETVGYPFNQFPAKMFCNGAAGYGVASLCGSLGGACAVIGLFCEAEDARALRDQLYEWYKVEPFPSYQPEMESVTTVANSVLCADSVGAYMEATGYAMSDPGRLARCAGLSAEVAVKTIELLNIHFGFEAAPVVEEAPAEEEETLGENEYIGVGTSEIGGEIKVKVTMDGDKIAKIEVLSHNETAGLADPALEQIPEAIIAAQSTSVDAITGATKTSEALIAAVNDALSQVK